MLPHKFIPVLESSGMIVEVGRWVVEESCRQLGEWERKGYRYAISLNVSPKQFSDESFVTEVRNSIKRHGVSPELLDFEITESLLVEDVQEAIDRLEAIKALGCSISIDDFGTGYSSLAYLKQFPIDRLKIDREFVKDYPENDDGIVASSIVALAKTLKMRVLAEGIETPEQYQFLRDCGCEEYQGYICSKPVDPEACEELLVTYNTEKKIELLLSSATS
jgi:EAL domain-containing protein (putative c-di-GMP-specific phosphodiesterase class I)